MRQPFDRSAPRKGATRVAVLCLVLLAAPGSGDWAPDRAQAQPHEQRIDMMIRNYGFMLAEPAPVRVGVPTVIILRNQDIVRHGFTSDVFPQLQLHAEGEGIAAYGKGVDGFYVDAGKTLVIRFTAERAGRYAFHCDLHPQMKGELFTLEVPAA